MTIHLHRPMTEKQADNAACRLVVSPIQPFAVSLEKYFDTLSLTLSRESDDDILRVMQDCPIPFRKQTVLFQNHGPCLDALELVLLRSRRVLLWPRLVELGVSPMCLIPPQRLRLYSSGASKDVFLEYESPGSSTATTIADAADSAGIEQPITRWTVLTATHSQLLAAGCRTLLALAAKLSRPAIFLSLLQAIPVDERTSDVVEELNTALRIACESGPEDVVSVLLKEGANPNCARDDCCLPLHAAVKDSQKNSEKLRRLLDFKASPNLVCPLHGVSALMAAVQSRDVRLLLERGADSNVTMPHLGLPTALFYAVYWGYEEIVRALCDHGGVDLGFRNQSGETVLDIARHSLKFAETHKPRHIERLPLPRTNATTCRHILMLLESYRPKEAASPLYTYSSSSETCNKLDATASSLTDSTDGNKPPFFFTKIQSPFEDNCDSCGFSLKSVSYRVLPDDVFQ